MTRYLRAIEQTMKYLIVVQFWSTKRKAFGHLNLRYSSNENFKNLHYLEDVRMRKVCYARSYLCSIKYAQDRRALPNLLHLGRKTAEM